MKQKLYFIDYDDTGEGCPSYTGGKFFKDNVWTGDHEWEFDDPNSKTRRKSRQKYFMKYFNEMSERLEKLKGGNYVPKQKKY